uniref:ATP-binding cassette sub-family A member 2 n=1 Tax=Ornithodoros turicata TaxID=34597 RepID=A0A2R5LDX6_9ACAR
MGFCLQLRLLLWKNYTLKKRKPLVLLFELVIPLVLFFILIGIRKKQPAYPVKSSSFPAFPLPSAGVIAVMQAFCDNGVRDENGFATFPNSTVTAFLERLKNISQHHNFFQPGFTLNEMDLIPSIFRTVVEDPVALHDCFMQAPAMRVDYFLKDPGGLGDFLVANFSMPRKEIDVLLSGSLDMKQVYSTIFGKLDGDQPSEGSTRLVRDAALLYDTSPVPLEHLSLRHLHQFLNILHHNPKGMAQLLSIVQWIFNTDTAHSHARRPPHFDPEEVASNLAALLLSPEVLRMSLCQSNEMPTIIVINASFTEENRAQLHDRLCNLTDQQMDILSSALISQVDNARVAETLALDQWNLSAGREHVRKLADDLHRFNLFETSVREISELASDLPQDACHNSNDTDVEASLNDTTSEVRSHVSSKQNVLNKVKKTKPQYGLLRIWLGMQRMICGKVSKASTESISADDGNLNLDDIGVSEYQKEQIGILVHVLYSNPKVLFTPNNTAANLIIKKANETFELLDMVTRYSKKMLNVSHDIRDYLAWNTTDHSLAILRHIRENLRRYPLILEVTRSESLQTFAFGDGSGASVIEDKEAFVHRLDVIDNAACSWISLMSGLSLNMFRGFRTQEDLMAYFKNRAYFDNVTVLASVLFGMSPNGTMPRHMTYTIRQNASFTSTTNLMRSRFWFPGPRNWGYEYYQFGFVWLQDILERAMVNVYTGQDITAPGTYIHQFPYPCYIQDQFLFMIEHVMPLCMAISWVYSVAMLVQNVVYEKEKRLKEVMKTMGLNSAVHWLAWFISSFVQMTITAAILTALLKSGRVLTYSNPFIFFLVLETFVIANITFSFLVSVLYSKAKLAAACAGIIYFLSYVPYMYIAVREEAAHDNIPAWLKTLASLLSTTAFGLGAKYFAFYEEVGAGVQWSNLGVSPLEDDSFSLAHVASMMLADALLYSFLVWYIENVHPGSYGLPKPWYFPLTQSYWLGGSRPDGESGLLCSFWHKLLGQHQNPADFQSSEEEQACALEGRAHMDSGYFEPDPAELPLGVCIDNLVKVYKDGDKLAVNRLSLNLYEGQITSFLGHNGAGKTTTMSILTGLFPPTSGYATIYGRDIRTEMDIIRQSMGMCPQHNVLFDELTVEEHLWFYARLKDTPDSSIRDEMDRMIQDLSLPLKRHSKVDSLSGGMKRKLSVAIAFVGGSHVVILDEPTAGVDPYSRRAIWDLILKYKKDRTILLSTHHMDEADVLGDRIAVISHGQLRCCGTSLFLKNNLGEGYHLILVKKPTQNSMTSNNQTLYCMEGAVSAFIKKHVPTAVLVWESQHELHYILPLAELKRGSFEKLFSALETSLERLGISSYGIKNTTLEEVFLKVAQEAGHSEDERCAEPAKRPKVVSSAKRCRSEEKQPLTDFGCPLNDLSGTAGHGDDRNSEHHNGFANAADDDYGSWEGMDIGGRVSGKLLLVQQLSAILLKRYWCTRRNWKGLFAQILLPAFFVAVAMSVALTAPHVEDPPSLVLSPSRYYNYTQPGGNVLPYAYRDGEHTSWSKEADAHQLASTLRLPSGIGATCVLRWPLNGTSSILVQSSSLANYSDRSLDWDMLGAFEPQCRSVFVPGLPLDNFVPPLPTVETTHATSGSDTLTAPGATPIPRSTQRPGVEHHERFYPYCECSSDKTGYVCESTGFHDPPMFRALTGDILLDISSQNEHEYFLYTTDMFRLRRYGAFSFGLIRDYVPKNFGKDAPALFRKIAVRSVAKVWYNNKGYHAMPTYINSMNNAVLRANLPPEKGHPSTYGITVINHPMTDTSFLLSKDQILQGTDVLIAIFIIVAMSFVPASFVLFLVYERFTKAKHLQFVSGVNPVVYWLANYFWDMCSYVVPATCCVLILLIFDIPAYTSAKNFPAVLSLFLMYGWSVTPVMYPVSFLFKEPSTAYIFLIVINLFVGITCIVTSFLLEVFSYDAYLGELHHVLKTVFLMFPNYCLGRGLMDIAFNEYQNFFLFKTGRYDRMRSPFAWDLVTRNLVAMAFSGTLFLVLTLLLEFNFFLKPKRVIVPEALNVEEDEDVQREKRRVLSGRAHTDMLYLKNLTKIYHTRKLGKHLAVDRLCLGVPKGECFGLLGVNGAGKSTTFKMLTGDTGITSGDAYLNGHSVCRDFARVQQYVGYCPQFDALYEELTAREHLQLYARFRGIPVKEESKVIEWTLHKLGLTQYADRVVATYSGGNKRKLSTAIALLGGPAVIYLDEPTTGMDPYTRRFLWDLIHDLVQGGRSVILTSHSMEECEALCTRLAIMVNGHFKCLGSIQHLKNRFGEGYCVTARLRDGAPTARDTVAAWFDRAFPNATLKEKHFNMLQYELKSKSLSLAYVFCQMEQALKELPIEEYSVCQNTLDNVFINFVKQQSERGREPTWAASRHATDVFRRFRHVPLDDTIGDSDDDDIQERLQKSQSHLEFLNMDVEC